MRNREPTWTRPKYSQENQGRLRTRLWTGPVPAKFRKPRTGLGPKISKIPESGVFKKP